MVQTGSRARFKDWCKLLGLEIVGGEFLAFYPAMNSLSGKKARMVAKWCEAVAAYNWGCLLFTIKRRRHETFEV